jgi:hypothetical protein
MPGRTGRRARSLDPWGTCDDVAVVAVEDRVKVVRAPHAARPLRVAPEAADVVAHEAARVVARTRIIGAAGIVAARVFLFSAAAGNGNQPRAGHGQQPSPKLDHWTASSHQGALVGSLATRSRRAKSFGNEQDRSFFFASRTVGRSRDSSRRQVPVACAPGTSPPSDVWRSTGASAPERT